MQRVELSGRAYAFHDVGEGTPLLLFHGFPFTSKSYWPQLEAPPKGFRLIAPDHRGFGGSALTGDGPSTMEDFARDGLALLDALGVPAAVVGGVSMGGYVALALTRLAPERVRGLALIDTQSTPDDEAGQARREAVAQDVLQHGLAGLTATMLPKLLSAKTGDAVRAKVEAMMLLQSPRAVAAAARGMGARHDTKEVLAGFRKPTLVIVGDEDQITPIEKAKLMAGLVAGSTLAVIPEAAHLPNLEQPARFNAELEAFAKSF